MAKPKLRLFKAFRLSRKFALIAIGTLLLIGGSGAAAVAFAPPDLIPIPGFGGKKEASCKTIYKTQFTRAAEKRILAVIASDAIKPEERVRNGIRIARYIAEGGEHPDLVIVHVTDMTGPTNRSELRGHAIGAEIVHAPEHGHTRATGQEWEVRYMDAVPNAHGLFFGERKIFDAEAAHDAAISLEEPEGCDLDEETDEKVAHADTGQDKADGDHGKEGDGHGAASGHDAPKDSGHGSGH